MTSSDSSEKSGADCANSSGMAQNGSMAEALDVLQKLSHLVTSARDELQAEGFTKDALKLPWMEILKSDLNLAKELLTHLNNGGMDLWRAKEFLAKGRSLLHLIEGQLDHFNEF